FILLSFAGMAMAQNAPNFSVTDSKGTEHRLYEDYTDQGKTVVIKIFHTSCSICARIAPRTQSLYEDWGEGSLDVEFFELSNRGSDTDARVNSWKSNYNLTFPGVGADGGSLQAIAPYRDGTFGEYIYQPTYIVIGPDKSVQFDIGRGMNDEDKIDAIDAAIESTGARRPGTTSVENTTSFESLKIFPNPVLNDSKIEFRIDQLADIRFSIINILGRNIEDIYLQNQPSGTHIIPFDMTNAAKGNYFLRVEVNGKVEHTLRIMKL
ncbi:MAG: redoxin domain-containing protein, partial [Bacteroidota bacterium]